MDEKMIGGTFGKAKSLREPAFAELPDAEKVERLWNAVRELQRSIAYLHELAAMTKSMAEQHEHGHDGKPLFQAHVLSRGGQLARSARDDLA